MPKLNNISEKEKAFCREYIKNGGCGYKAYLTAYNTKCNTNSAMTESSELLKKDRIRQYIDKLNKPLEMRAISERQKKIDVLWSIVNAEDSNYNDKCRALDILNKMQNEYKVIVEEQTTDLSTLSIDEIRKMAQ